MRKIILILLVGVLSISGYIFTKKSINQSADNFIQPSQLVNIDITESDVESVIALLLYDNIDSAIQTYYGQPTQFALYDAKILIIERIDNSFSFDVLIEVPTFHGAHNPPYGLERMRFAIKPGDVELKEYKHIDVNG